MTEQHRREFVGRSRFMSQEWSLEIHMIWMETNTQHWKGGKHKAQYRKTLAQSNYLNYYFSYETILNYK